MGGVLNINYDHLLDCLSLIRKMIEKNMTLDFNYLQQPIKKAFLKIRSDVFSELLF